MQASRRSPSCGWLRTSALPGRQTCSIAYWQGALAAAVGECGGLVSWGGGIHTSARHAVQRGANRSGRVGREEALDARRVDGPHLLQHRLALGRDRDVGAAAVLQDRFAAREARGLEAVHEANDRGAAE